MPPHQRSVLERLGSVAFATMPHLPDELGVQDNELRPVATVELFGLLTTSQVDPLTCEKPSPTKRRSYPFWLPGHPRHTTGLANYREFVDTLERELHRAERNYHSFSLLPLDLNALRRINDRLGHLAGNKALNRLARMMKKQCRTTDLITRYGGDEFAVVLIDSNQRMAEHVAQRIETRVREDAGEPPISVSIGLSVYPCDERLKTRSRPRISNCTGGREKCPTSR